MKAIKKTALQIKLLAINTLYKYSKEIIKYESDHFRQFTGKDILKVDGSIKQKFDHEKLEFSGQDSEGNFCTVNYWIRTGYKCLEVTVKVCVNGGSYDVKPTTAFCQYEQQTYTLFHLENGLLVDDVKDTREFLDEIYSEAELLKLQAEIKEAAKVYEATADKMPYIFKGVLDIERLTR